MDNKVVSIAAHPKFRDASALRRFLNGEDVASMGEMDSGDWKMLHELQQWSAGLSNVGLEPPPKLMIGRTEGKSVPTNELLKRFTENSITMRADFKYMTRPEVFHDHDA